MRLELTRSSDLAVRLLRMLAEAPGRLKAADLAVGVGATPGFVPQVLAPLVDRRWVRSDPGPSGGYSLLADLEALTVIEVIEAVEGPTESGRCVLDGAPCAERGACVIHDAWLEARETLLRVLADTPVSQARPGRPL